MKRRIAYLAVATVLFAMTGPAQALLTGGPDIIPAPASVIDDPPGATNDHQQAFNERQSVLLAADLSVDGGSIPAGTRVDSHMIFLNTATGSASDTQTWTFDGNVLGVMSDGTGSLEVASSPLLGAPGTIYPGTPFTARGLESADGYSVSGNEITVRMGVSEPGDWIRVVTAAIIDVAVDIKPQSCPNPLNVVSQGILPVALLGTPDFDVTTVDPASIRLMGVAPLRWSLEDVATPVADDTDDCACTTAGADGFDDLTLKFDTQEIVAALGPVNDGDVIALELNATLLDGTAATGADCVVIRSKGKPE